MTVSEQQLSTWSNIGAETTAASTYQSVRLALDAIQWRAGNRAVDIYLQGSYRNKTNIYGDSDVDVVCELPGVFRYDISRLTEADRNRFNQAYSNAEYTFAQFRQAVLEGLRDRFGTAATSGNKCINIAKAPGRLAADVVPCLSYRNYTSFSSYTEGITFFDQHDGRQVVNYPIRHIENGSAKNAALRTQGFFKPTVRVFNNWRNALEAERILRTPAPSYFVECLLYNVPDAPFRESTYRGMVLAILQFLHAADFKTFTCQNGVVPLCGGTPEQWRESDARAFLSACITNWNAS